MIEYEIYFEKVPNDNAAEDKSGYKAGYEQASKDVWEMACDIYSMGGEELVKAFYDCCGCIPFNESVEKVIYNYNEYKAKKAEEAEDAKLHVGDEVIDGSGNACVITNIDTSIHVIYNKNHKTHKWGKNTKFKKTGNHFDMIEL